MANLFVYICQGTHLFIGLCSVVEFIRLLGTGDLGVVDYGSLLWL